MATNKWAKAEDVARVTVSFGSGDLSLGDLITGWATEVLKFYGDLDSNWNDPDPLIWGGHDLMGSYHLRDAIESGLDSLEAFSGTRRVATLDAVDELFRCFTVDDVEAIALFEAKAEQGTGWWWRRIPERGPVVQQLTEMQKSQS